MQIFIFWVVIIAFILSIYVWNLFRRSPKGFRFQVKLTIIFFLLVLIPSIPLTFFVSDLLTRGFEMFLLPGLEKSLLQSLEVIKFQLEERGELFLNAYPDVHQTDEQLLKNHGIVYHVNIEHPQQTPEQWDITGPANELFIQSPSYRKDLIETLIQNEIKSNIFQTDSQIVCEVYQVAENGGGRIVGFSVDPRVIAAKNKISESLRMYNSISVFKDSVVEGQVIWALSTVFIIILTLLAIYAAKRLSRGLSEPIQELVIGMQRVANGDLSRPVQVKAKDEIKFLIESFNNMARDLKLSQEKLVQAERLAAWQDVARRVSHEIKNALTPIQLSLRRLRDRFVPEDQTVADKSLLTIQDEVESLTRIAEEFAEFARMPTVNLQPENLNEIIRNLTTLIEAEPHAIKIELDLDDTLPLLDLDRGQIRRALHNLLKNSIEASNPGSTITISTQRIETENQKVKIAIVDHGAGMPHEILAKIFDPYFTTKQRGMGLGLSIVKRIIEDHNGEIDINSAPGRGTKVTIFF